MKRLKEFLNRRFAINCETEEEAKELINILIKNNILWNNKKNLDGNTNFSVFKDNTCYCIGSYGLMIRHKNTTETNYQIIKFKDLKENKIITNNGEINKNEKVKVKIKTLEELLDTNDIVIEQGNILYKGDTQFLSRWFAKNMRELCGKEFEIEEIGSSTYCLEGKYYIGKWMCSEWGEIDEEVNIENNIKKDELLKILKDNLELNVFIDEDKFKNSLKISLSFDGEELDHRYITKYDIKRIMK